MEAEGSLPCSQQSATCAYPEPHQPAPRRRLCNELCHCRYECFIERRYIDYKYPDKKDEDAPFSTLKMLTRCSSGTLLSASKTARCYSPEDHPLIHCSKNLKIHIRLALPATWKFSSIKAENFKKTYDNPSYVTPLQERTAIGHVMWNATNNCPNDIRKTG